MGEQCVPLNRTHFTASGDVSRYRFIGFDGAHCGAGAKANCVSVFDASDTTPGTGTDFGSAVVEAGGVVAVGDPIASDANGKAVKAADLSVTLTAGDDTVDADGAHTFAGGVLPVTINGYAREAASGAGVFIEVKLV